MRLPGPTDRVLLVAAVGAFVGALAGRFGIGLAVGAAGVIAGVASRWLQRGGCRTTIMVGAVAVALGAVSGAASLASEAGIVASSIPIGRFEAQVTLLTDPLETDRGWVVRADSEWGPLLLAGDGNVPVTAGQVAEVRGVASDTGGLFRGRPYAGRVSVAAINVVRTRSWFVAPNRLRERVAGGLNGFDGPGAALVSGFLIGDIAKLPEVHEENLRAAGLAHYVAVSGSNVALFLGLWWVLTAPLASRPKWRALSGVVGVGLYVLVTRWEPSVLRAAAMVTVVLVGRASGLPISGWGAWSSAVTGLVLADPVLAQQVGFQLSAAATLGLLTGAGALAGRGPTWLTAPLGATIAAQLAVSPLLLWYFGEVPLFSPLTNLVAGPVVALSTAIGGVGVLTGVGSLTRIAVGLGEVVIWVAGKTAGLPAVGWSGLGMVGLAALLWRVRRLRPLAGVAIGLVVIASTVLPTGVTGPALVALDVGQGDAVLLLGSSGERILIDGGPDPRVLTRKLREYRIRSLDLVVMTHGHADHVAGLSAVFGVIPVGEVWWSPHDEPSAVDALVDTIVSEGIPMTIPRTGVSYQLGTVILKVVGPVRKYAAPNDASLVITASVNGRTVALAGEVEAVAQQDIGAVSADVLKVPHHGAATSDRAWLTASAGAVAIIPVGPNDFGHPVPWVIEALEAGGAVVCRTDRDGDVVIRLDYSEPAASGC